METKSYYCQLLKAMLSPYFALFSSQKVKFESIGAENLILDKTFRLRLETSLISSN